MKAMDTNFFTRWVSGDYIVIKISLINQRPKPFSIGLGRDSPSKNRLQRNVDHFFSLKKFFPEVIRKIVYLVDSS